MTFIIAPYPGRPDIARQNPYETMNRVNIIGGGIGGLTAAHALRQAGLDFELYEQAPALTEGGAGIGLSKAAVRVLDRLHLGEQIRQAGTFIKHGYLLD